MSQAKPKAGKVISPGSKPSLSAGYLRDANLYASEIEVFEPPQAYTWSEIVYQAT